MTRTSLKSSPKKQKKTKKPEKKRGFFDEFSFGQDYALTLEHWLKNFDEKVKEIKALGFDQKFVRMWRFYLTCCIAAFRHGRTDVVQWELDHAA